MEKVVGGGRAHTHTRTSECTNSNRAENSLRTNYQQTSRFCKVIVIMCCCESHIFKTDIPYQENDVSPVSFEQCAFLSEGTEQTGLEWLFSN